MDDGSEENPLLCRTLMSAWIETSRAWKIVFSDPCRTLMSAWIETIWFVHRPLWVAGRTLMSAWIET